MNILSSVTRFPINANYHKISYRKYTVQQRRQNPPNLNNFWIFPWWKTVNFSHVIIIIINGERLLLGQSLYWALLHVSLTLQYNREETIQDLSSLAVVNWAKASVIVWFSVFHLFTIKKQPTFCLLTVCMHTCAHVYKGAGICVELKRNT